MNSRFLFQLAIVFISFPAFAQSPSHQIKALTKPDKSGVWLRWAPTDFATWQLGNKYGYRIERYTVQADGTVDNEQPYLVRAIAIKPYPEQMLDQLSNTIPEAAMISELIYDPEGTSASPAETPMALLRQREETDNRFGIALLICDLSPKIAEAAGLFVNDSSAVKGDRYIYKIMVAQNPVKITVEPAVAVVDVKEVKPLQAFTDVEAMFGDKTVTISWPTLTHTGVYSAYRIEKSGDGKSFQPVSKLPYIPMSQSDKSEEAHFVDSLQTNNAVYYYRVKGITPFGEEGPSSNIVSGAGKDNLAGLIVLREVRRDDKNKVVVRWEFPPGYESKIRGFMLSRAPKAEGPFTDVTAKVLPTGTRETVDNASASSTYYRVRAVDASGEGLAWSMPYFFHVEDNKPPAIPSALQGIADNNGAVHLTWEANKDNDLLGYRIFSSNDPTHEFVEVTTVILSGNHFMDSINTKLLNQKIYYKLVAVDNNYNTSDYSKALAVDRPDLIPPAAPVFLRAEKKDKSISLQWINSVSNDVTSYTLYRTAVNDTARTRLLNWRSGTSRTSYVDENIPEGKTYQYWLHVMDGAGNKVEVASKEIKFDSGIRKEVTEFKALIDREKKVIVLRWEYPEKIKKCLLYRKINDEPFSLYQSLESERKEFIDKQVRISTTYSYKIQLVLESNVKTELSETLKVPF